jgi:hypothetical protein
MSESNITAYVNDSFTFFKSAYYVQFLLIMIVFHRFFTWIVLGDVDLCFSLMLVRKSNAFAVN